MPRMANILVTGFTPFDGRQVNASWIAAASLAGDSRLDTLEIPVRWGAPASLLEPLCRERCPEAIIAMGEGRQGWFDIETVARNERRQRPDNDGVDPAGPIVDDGPPHLDASIDAPALHRRLLARGFPVRVSSNAGQYLCEEMLYTLETLRARHSELATVTFVHLPPYSTPLFVGRQATCCSDAVLGDFASALLDAVLEVHAARSERA